MIKKISIFSCFLLFSIYPVISVNAQNKDTVMNHQTFNVQEFKKNNGGNTYNYINKEGFNTRQFAFSDGYKEELNKENSPYVYHFVYNRDGKLNYQSTEFYKQDVGKEISYNDQQQIIKEVDHGPHFKISIEQLAGIMKHCCNIDILDTRQVDSVLIKYNSYEVYAYNNEDLRYFHSYLIDANTGKILFKTDEIPAQIGENPEDANNVKTLLGEWFKSDEFKKMQKH